MPSLFSRARTNSSTNRKNLPSSGDNFITSSFDEFGRVSSRLSNRTFGSPSKKEKKAKENSKRGKKSSPGQQDSEDPPEPVFPDGAFLPLNLERPRNGEPTPEHSKEHDYSFLSYERHVVLGIEQVERLVEVVSEELETRGGITTPFIFTTAGLDISSSAIKRLIRTFLNTCEPNSGQNAEALWREEARFVGPYELAMCLRWGLARVIRSVGGQDIRGLVSWEHYLHFRDSETALGYPPTHFATCFLPPLPPPLQIIIVRLLSLLARLTANSTSSGHTPPSLSPLFGPLFFGLGPATLAFHHTYTHYLWAVNAMEHIILAFIRWQDAPRVATSPSGSPGPPSPSAASLGVPVRLKEWIKGYPAMLPFLENKKPQPRRGSRTVRVVSVRRNVRMYSPDLVKTASTWAHRPSGTGVNNGLANSKEWERIAPASLKLQPRYSDAYKKRMDMPSNFHPDVAPGAILGMSLSSSTSSYRSNASSSTGTSTLPEADYFGLGVRGNEDRFRSLTDLKWGEFETMGFSELGDNKKLQFDLTESARLERTAKRQSMSWNDFSSSGFSRMDAPLTATLQFSTPFANQISSWPSQNSEISKKLKKSQKSLPAFGWDTEPVMGAEEVIEEAFLDVFCDLIYGGGWMDLERGEMLDRDCNWALVEYKCLPPTRGTAAGGSDPRTATALMLFEEFVPLEYRQQLAITSSSRRRLPSLFSPGKKQWKQAATLNGRPYVVGHVPHSPSYQEVEFEGLLHGTTSTKVISLTKSPRIPTTASTTPLENTPVPVESSLPPIPPVPPLKIKKSSSGPLKVSQSEQLPAHKNGDHSDPTASPSVKKLFRLPTTPGSNRKSMMIPAEYSTVEFETRMASYSDEEHNGNLHETEAVKQKRRESRDDAWVDILIGSQTRRKSEQDAEFADRRRGHQSKLSDPDVVGLEIAQVLATVRNRTPSPPSVIDRVDRDYGMDHHVRDLDVDEVETIPRMSIGGPSIGSDESEAALAYNNNNDQPESGDVENLDPSAADSILNSRHLAKYQRRIGYFDLHPDRRQALAQTSLHDDEDELRAKLAEDSDDDDEVDDDRVYGPPEGIRPLPAPPVPQVQPRVLEPSSVVNSVPAAIKPPSEVKEKLPFSLPEIQNDNVSNTAPSTPSKTASLIEMYRERERGSPLNPAPTTPTPIVVAPLAPSRLPVRIALLPKEGAPLPQPSLLSTPPPKVSSPPKTSPPPETTIRDNDLPPRIQLEETGRNSPARYVHGAPLHNVLEEEEE